MGETRVCEVLVLGAGPTGLLAAWLLRRVGVDVRLIEKRDGPSVESRAVAMSARSMELLASLGLADALFTRGFINPGADFFVAGRRVGGLDFDRAAPADTPYPFILLIPQSDTEVVLIEALEAAGGRVERGIEALAVTQDADGVALRASGPGGEPQTWRARYLIGADGAHSLVRKALNLSFAGAAYPQTFLLGDVQVDWGLDHERLRIFMNGERLGLYLPIPGTKRSRIMTTDRSADLAAGSSPHPEPSGEAADNTELELENLQAAFAEATGGMAVQLSQPGWLARFRTHHRMVDRYRVGRMFVAGDAAHIHSPAGGQGMNTGLQDAANLAWKLAGVLRGADSGLLDTYESERLPVARDVLQLSDRLFSMAAGQTGWQASLRDWLAPVVAGSASHLGFVQDQAFRKLAQLEINYPPSHCVEGRVPGGPAPRPGERAPNARLSRHRDVFDLLQGYGFRLLALSRRRLEVEAVAPLLARLRGLCSPAAEVHLVARLDVGEYPEVARVERPDVFEAYGLHHDHDQALVLVRPDGYVAWRRESLEAEDCARLLAQLGGGGQGC